MPVKARKVCSEGGCNTIAPPGRNKCDDHRLAKERRSRSPAADYGTAWRKLSRRIVRDHVERHGWLCPGYKVPPHRVEPGRLTGHHLLSPLDGGDVLDEANVQVLCLRCNARAGRRGGG